MPAEINHESLDINDSFFTKVTNTMEVHVPVIVNYGTMELDIVNTRGNAT